MNLERRKHLAGHMVVWIARVSQARASLPHLESCLDAGDRQRAARFHFAEDRARFVLGRGLLRKCLGYHLRQTPETIELATTEFGRPVLAGNREIQFSLTHTGDLVAVAVTSGAQIGIDLELVQPQRDLPGLAERIFSPEDLREFLALSPGDQTGAFYRAWTRKEAYLKARGEGIAAGLQGTSVSFGQEEAVTLRNSPDETDRAQWQLLALPLPADYAGCLACDDREKQL
ncbi:MAG TPA: 4'-phosphopantetheinyl transferase superfamily protein, partial [Candidatus Methylacidiphilales bacterium]